MSIKGIAEKIKSLRARLADNEKDIYIGLILVLVAVGAFGLGRLSKTQDLAQAVTIENLDTEIISIETEKRGDNSLSNLAGPVMESSSGLAVGKVVASKNSTKYHLPECSGARRIKEENKIWFNSIEEAKKAGYEPAANCPGLN